jgi:drug/metabolite transporter (DMT)-like permease
MPWLVMAFLANGVAQFLQKYLHAAGLGGYQSSALVMMYAAGTLAAIVLLAAFKGRLGRRELLAGGVVGICSYLGNFAVLRALGWLPAYTVFPLVVGGSILLVATVSWLLMGEKVSAQTRWGILCGVAAVALLTIG